MKITYKIKNIEIKPSVTLEIKDMTQIDSTTYQANKLIALNKIKAMIIEYAMSLQEDVIEETFE